MATNTENTQNVSWRAAARAAGVDRRTGPKNSDKATPNANGKKAK